jgi:hypothetical protein
MEYGFTETVLIEDLDKVYKVINNFIGGCNGKEES